MKMKESLLDNFLKKRYLADSNRRMRFCRPVPNLSAKVPCFGLQR